MTFAVFLFSAIGGVFVGAGTKDGATPRESAVLVMLLGILLMTIGFALAVIGAVS